MKTTLTEKDMNTIVNCLNSIYNSMNRIEDLWSESEKAENVSYVLEENYPFPESFDDFLESVWRWRNSANEKLVELYENRA